MGARARVISGGGVVGAGRARVWAGVVSDALRGRGGDPTAGPVGRAIVLLAVPMMLEMAMESVFAVVDIWFVSRLGAAAMAAVGLTESAIALVYTVAMGLGIGATAVVARRIGEGDGEGASIATVQAMLLGLGVSALIALAAAPNAGRLLALMGADDEVLRIGTGYAAVSLASNGTVMLLFMLNAAFRGAGDAAVAMRVLWLANALNIVLDPLLIFGVGPFPELGVTGAAVATAIGRGAGVALQLAILAGGAARLHVAGRHVRLQAAAMARMLRLSLTGMLQGFVATASWIVLVRIVTAFGPEAVAGYTIGVRVLMFALLPAWGLANAAATMVGQGLGAGDPDRAERAVWLAGRMNMAFLGGVGVFLFVGAGWVAGLFGGDAATLGHAADCLRIVSIGYIFYGLGMVLGQSFNGAGDVWTPTLLNVACFWCWEIPLAWLLATQAGLGPDGVFVAVLVAFTTYALAAAAIFRRGRWKLVRV